MPAEVDGTPKPTAQRNFTDPDSRIMVKGGEFLQGYNAQAAVDAESQIIVAAAVTNQPPDQEHLAPMLAQVVANCGQRASLLARFVRSRRRTLTLRGVHALVDHGFFDGGALAHVSPARARCARRRMSPAPSLV